MRIKNQHKLCPGDHIEMFSKMPSNESNPFTIVHIDTESNTGLSNVLGSDAVDMVAVEGAPQLGTYSKTVIGNLVHEREGLFDVLYLCVYDQGYYVDNYVCLYSLTKINRRRLFLKQGANNSPARAGHQNIIRMRDQALHHVLKR